MSVRARLVVIGVPSLGTVSLEWALAFSQLVYPMATVIGKNVCKGRSVAEARNEIARAAFDLADVDETELTHVFFLDDDVLPAPHVLPRLLGHRVPIVSGVYFSRCEASEPLIFSGPYSGSERFEPGAGLKAVWGHGMGLTLIAAEVFRRMNDGSLEADRYGNPCWFRTQQGEIVEQGGKRVIVNRTEDLYFLDAANKLGYQPHVDCSPTAFGWHYDRRTQRGYPYPQWCEFREKQTVTWPTPEGPVVWR